MPHPERDGSDDRVDAAGGARGGLAEHLAREAAAPPGLEDRLVERLAREGQLVERPGAGAIFARAAALLMLVLGGFLTGRASSSGPPRASHLLLVRASDWSTDPARRTGDLERAASEYGAWARDLAQRGLLVGAGRLTEDGWVVGAAAADPLPPTRPGVSTSGYFLLSAGDDRRALELAQGCPHLGYGGELELRGLAE